MTKKPSLAKHFLAIILLLFLFNGSLGQIGALNKNTCKDNPKLNNAECFTYVIQFENYRSGKSVISSKNNLIIEYSRNSNHSERLFYGIKPDGYNYFQNDSFIKVINLTDDGLGLPRYESVNYIVIEEEEEYLCSSSISCNEMYKIETIEMLAVKDQEEFYKPKFFPGFHLNEKRYIYGVNHVYEYNGEYRLSLYEFDDNYVDKIGVGENNDIKLTLFPIKDDEDHEFLISIRLNSSFLIIELLNLNFEFQEIKPDFKAKYTEKSFDNSNIFYKSIQLQKNIFAFIYLNNYNDNKLIFTNYTHIIDRDSPSFDNKYEWDFDLYLLNPEPTLSDFIKYDDYRLTLISNKNLGNILEIFLFYINENYDGIKVNHYSYLLNDYILNKDVTATYWNNYLVFMPSVSVMNNIKMDSFLFIFGFANGTDSTIDISSYLSDIENNNNNSNDTLTTELLNLLIIDNNIFGYTTTGEVILHTMPDVLVFNKVNGDTKVQIKSGTIIKINDTIEINQKKDIIKTNILYNIECQFVIKSTEENFDSMAHSQYKDSNYNNKFNDSIYYSRKYNASFKLCYKNCLTCKEMGISYYDQKCESCPNIYYDDNLNRTINYTFTDGNCLDPNMQTTIITTIPITIPTTIPTTITTTIPTTINTTNIPTSIPTTIPTTITTTNIPTSIPTTNPTTIPSTIINTIPPITTTIPNISSIISTALKTITTIPEISTNTSHIIQTLTTVPFSTSIYTTIISTIPEKLESTIPKTIYANIPTTSIKTTPSSLISNIPTTQGIKTTEVIIETEQTQEITNTPIPTTIKKEGISTYNIYTEILSNKNEPLTSEKITNTPTTSKIESLTTEKVKEITERITSTPSSENIEYICSHICKNFEPIETNHMIETTEKKEKTELIILKETTSSILEPSTSSESNTLISFLGISHFRANESLFSFNIYLAPIQNIIYSNLLKFPVIIYYNANIRLLKEVEANCNKKNGLYDSKYQYFCEVHEETKNIRQIRMEPEFDFVTQSNITLIGITPFAKEFMNDVQKANDKYDIISNNTIFILNNSTYTKYDELFFNISGLINGPKPKLSNKNLILYINIESETNSKEEIQCKVTNILFDNYSLSCKANKAFKGDLQSAVSYIDDGDILLVNFDKINQSSIDVDIETNRKFFVSKNSGGLKPGFIAIIVIIPIIAIAAIIVLTHYFKKKSNVDKDDNVNSSSIKNLNLKI